MCIMHDTSYYDTQKKKKSCMYMYIVRITCMQMSVKSVSIIISKVSDEKGVISEDRSRHGYKVLVLAPAPPERVWGQD